MGKKRSRIVAGGMLRENTPLQDYTKEFGLWIKREDLSCPFPGPAFSKTRGVYAHIQSRSEKVIGVLDTYHSQAGHAVARACQILKKQCINYYPEYKYEPGCRAPQKKAEKLGAQLDGLKAGRSAILFHQAKKLCEIKGGYMMPNALKLDESIIETAKEVPQRKFTNVLIPISSGTIAAGVIRGMGNKPKYWIHLGYSRSHDQVRKYLKDKSGVHDARLVLIDEKYNYKDVSVDGANPPFPCNVYYDLKAFRWWMSNRKKFKGSTLFWNIG